MKHFAFPLSSRFALLPLLGLLIGLPLGLLGAISPGENPDKPLKQEASLDHPAGSGMLSEQEPPKNADDPVYTFAKQMPRYVSGEAEMIKFIKSQLAPSSESGLVVLAFVVKKDGKLEDFKVVKSESAALDAEALRLARLMQGKWVPGKQNGKAGRVQYTLPVHFAQK